MVKVDSGEVFEGICFQCNIFSTFLSGSLHLSCADLKEILSSHLVYAGSYLPQPGLVMLAMVGACVSLGSHCFDWCLFSRSYG